MRTFQGLLKRLESGQMSIHMCMEHACNFELGKESGIPAEHWQEALKDAVVWMDYLSMPQPNAKEIKRRQSITPTAEVQEALSARASKGKRWRVDIMRYQKCSKAASKTIKIHS